MTDDEQEFLSFIKKSYKQKEGHKIMLGCGSRGNFVASVYKDVEIKTKYGTDVAETSISNISETSRELFIKYLEGYMDRREAEV